MHSKAVPEVVVSVPEVVDSFPEVVESVPEVVESVLEAVESVPEVVESVPEVVESVPEVFIFAVENFAHAFSQDLFSRLRQKTWCKKRSIFVICWQNRETPEISFHENISQKSNWFGQIS